MLILRSDGNHMFDVMIIGGGPSGLSAALVLGRAKRSVLVIDNEQARNLVVQSSHGFLTRDAISPKELRQLAKKELKKYKTVQFCYGTAINLQQSHSTFTIEVGSLQFSAKKVIVASGLKEQLPNINGLKDLYGKYVFSCPYCDGWELRDQKLTVIGNGDKLIEYVKLIRQWSNEIEILTGGPRTFTNKDYDELKHRRIPIMEEEISGFFRERNELQIALSNGVVITCDAAFLLKTNAKQQMILPEHLQVKLKKNGSYETSLHGQTIQRGLYIIGDAAKRFTGLVGAASEGYEAGVHLNKELVEEEW
ncbi:NAD(P)/FAD-dependent oxidoreductase [Halalkalibacter sp. APA_J-10(15)]|uniref:NAD(P)/FAD-dependent oxidoreductase n=2 Tax=unclassified Halalkalibacter TaxID=2893063 RepID=UPI001FF2A0D7|nr:NAD(P)/FAD-dependent oxidoreductase [Halalkalibacter sp. APA_J-10(15)]